MRIVGLGFGLGFGLGEGCAVGLLRLGAAVGGNEITWRFISIGPLYEKNQLCAE